MVERFNRFITNNDVIIDKRILRKVILSHQYYVEVQLAAKERKTKKIKFYLTVTPIHPKSKRGSGCNNSKTLATLEVTVKSIEQP